MVNSSPKALVLYIPVLHQGYMTLLEKYRSTVDALYVVDQDIIDHFPRMQREIRAIPPARIVELLAATPFKNVLLANDESLTALAKQKPHIITSNEAVSDYLIEHYFDGLEVTQDAVFLRFDEKTVKAARQEIPFTGTISSEQFDQEILKDLHDSKNRSADWFLQVAAALITDKKVQDSDVNRRMPTPHSMWSLGDPRNYMEYGTDTHQRTVVHAEQTVIAHAARDGVATKGASIYVTAFPCPDCSQVIAEAGIKKVYFSEGYSELSTTDVFDKYEIEVIKVVQSDQTKPEPNQPAQ